MTTGSVLVLFIYLFLINFFKKGTVVKPFLRSYCHKSEVSDLKEHFLVRRVCSMEKLNGLIVGNWNCFVYFHSVHNIHYGQLYQNYTLMFEYVSKFQRTITADELSPLKLKLFYNNLHNYFQLLHTHL